TVLDGGFHRLMMRDVGRAPEAAKQVLWTVVRRRIQIAALAAPAALALAAWSIGNLRTWVLVALLVAARVVWDVVGSFSSVLFAFDKFWLPNLVEALRRSALLVTVVVLVLLNGPVEVAAAGTLLLCILGSGAIIRPAAALVADKTAPLEPSPWRDAA